MGVSNVTCVRIGPTYEEKERRMGQQPVEVAEEVCAGGGWRPDDMRCLVGKYRSLRREHGCVQADRRWTRKPFGWWLKALSDPHGELLPLDDADGRDMDCDAKRAGGSGDHSADVVAYGGGRWRPGRYAAAEPAMRALIVGMGQTMAIRDAMLMSMLLTDEESLIRQLACEPHNPQVSQRMYELMAQAFHDTSWRPDMDRVRRGLALLSYMASRAPRDMRVQPMAVMAYALWWLGDKRADDYVMQSLAIDSKCSLASIVLSALSRGVGPAWCWPDTPSQSNMP